MRDMGTLCAMGTQPILETDLDDVLVYLARYARQSLEYLEDQPLTRIFALADATNRLVGLENGKRPALDVGSSGEETR